MRVELYWIDKTSYECSVMFGTNWLYDLFLDPRRAAGLGLSKSVCWSSIPIPRGAT